MHRIILAGSRPRASLTTQSTYGVWDVRISFAGIVAEPLTCTMPPPGIVMYVLVALLACRSTAAPCKDPDMKILSTVRFQIGDVNVLAMCRCVRASFIDGRVDGMLPRMQRLRA